MEEDHDHVISEDSFLNWGLEIFYYDYEVKRMKEHSKIENFLFHFGSRPHVIATIWTDLLNTSTEEAKIDECCDDPIRFLWAHVYLKMYPKDRYLRALFHHSRNTCRKWIWYFIYKMAMLQSTKISIPENWKNAKDTFLFTVDGVHFWTKETSLPDFPYDRKLFSQKNKHAGYAYAIALSLSESRIVSISGPWKAGTNDVSIYKTKGGLMEKVPESCYGYS
jgi:hypothetical protein